MIGVFTNWTQPETGVIKVVVAVESFTDAWPLNLERLIRNWSLVGPTARLHIVTLVVCGR